MIPGEWLYFTDNPRIEINDTSWINKTIVNHYDTGKDALETFRDSSTREIVVCLDEDHKETYKLIRLGLEFFSLYDWVGGKGWRPIASKVMFQEIIKFFLDKIK